MTIVYCHACEKRVETDGEGCPDYVASVARFFICPIFNGGREQDRDSLDEAFMLGRKEKDDG